MKSILKKELLIRVFLELHIFHLYDEVQNIWMQNR